MRNADHDCRCPERPACDPHGWQEHGGGEPDACQSHGHHGETLAAIRRRDAEVDTDVLWRGWQTGHPVIARLVEDRRLLLGLLDEARVKGDEG
jgi:hypothetical protein